MATFIKRQRVGALWSERCHGKTRQGGRAFCSHDIATPPAKRTRTHSVATPPIQPPPTTATTATTTTSRPPLPTRPTHQRHEQWSQQRLQQHHQRCHSSGASAGWVGGRRERERASQTSHSALGFVLVSSGSQLRPPGSSRWDGKSPISTILRADCATNPLNVGFRYSLAG